VSEVRRVLLWPLVRLDAAFNRLYGWRYNPLYQSGALAVVLLLVVLVSGVYLLVFYRISDPYGSVVRLAGQAWAGRWIRSLHRYASDAAVVAVAVHAFRMFAQGRSWGPRALAWLTGLGALAVVWVCGWTGYVTVWDAHGLWLAREGARLLDVWPVFSEPLLRAFAGDAPLPRAFFFLNLFLHIALPLGLGLLLWLHVSRLARPVLAPPWRLVWAVCLLLVFVSALWPAPLGPVADVFREPVQVRLDLFYTFWLPWVAGRAAPWVWAWAGFAAAVALSVPWWTRPRRSARPEPSVVDERVCTGCRQCYLDCPYEAIGMVAVPGGRADAVARVDPELCVSCGICAGSCAPMGVGPRGRTGRDQLSAVRAFVADRAWTGREVVVVGCAHGPLPDEGAQPEAVPYPVPCAGALHTSVVEFLLRAGAGAVCVVACPPRDCWNREGARWAAARLFEGREAELQERVDRRRVALVYASAAERRAVVAAVAALRGTVAAAQAAAAEEAELVRPCEPVAEGS
jgi:ferredoxin